MGVWLESSSFLRYWDIIEEMNEESLVFGPWATTTSHVGVIYTFALFTSPSLISKSSVGAPLLLLFPFPFAFTFTPPAYERLTRVSKSTNITTDTYHL